MKEFNNQLLKFKITNDKIKMEISLKDLVSLFNTDPNNFDGDKPFVKIKAGKRQEFAEYIVNMLMDESPNNGDNTRWADPFADIFMEIFEGAEDDFCKYTSEDED